MFDSSKDVINSDEELEPDEIPLLNDEIG